MKNFSICKLPVFLVLLVLVGMVASSRSAANAMSWFALDYRGPIYVSTEDAKEIHVKFGSEILFDTGRAELKTAAEKALSQLVQLMRSYPGYPGIIEGHTDNAGAADSNQVLSQRRAEAVKNWLVSKGHIPDGCITTRGYGLTRPVASNETAEERQKNRRVEVRLVKPASPEAAKPSE